MFSWQRWSRFGFGFRFALRARILVAFLGSFLALVGGCGKKDAGKEAELAPWLPAKEYLEKLEGEKPLDGYFVRPPAGYSYVPQQAGALRNHIWQGGLPEDKSAPSLWVMIGNVGTREKNWSLEQGCEAIMKGVRQKMENYSEAPGEKGLINGIAFLRLTFQGQEKGPIPFEGRGVVYHGRDGGNFIHIMALDAVPNHEATLPLLETAARTFRKTP